MMLVGESAPFMHFSPPVVTRSNTVIFSLDIQTSAKNVVIEALAGANGQTNWSQATDYSYQIAPCPMALTPKNRLYFGGAGGTVFYCDSPDATNLPSFTRTAFYGINQYLTNSNSFNSTLHICTPITSDRYGDIFFGFQAVGTSPLGAQGGLARIDFDGSGTWIGGSNAIGTNISFQAAVDCAPALSVDQKTVYLVFRPTSGSSSSYLAAMDSRTLAPLASVSLIDPQTKTAALATGSSTASPTVGPDGDVYFGVLGNSGYHTESGWLLHFDSSLSVVKTPALFGWDVTDSIVDASLVPSYTGNSKYLLASKFNIYSTKDYHMAIFDPQQSVVDSQSGVTVMATVMSIPSPNAYEWCVNTSAIDPFTKSLLANNEDGNLYRWDFTSNLLTEKIELATTQTGTAYTPTVVGVDGTVYAINHGVLFAVGK